MNSQKKSERQKYNKVNNIVNEKLKKWKILTMQKKDHYWRDLLAMGEPYMNSLMDEGIHDKPYPEAYRQSSYNSFSEDVKLHDFEYNNHLIESQSREDKLICLFNRPMNNDIKLAKPIAESSPEHSSTKFMPFTKMDSISSVTNDSGSAVKSKLQAVIMADSKGRSLSKTEILFIQQLLIDEIDNYSFYSDLRGPDLRFNSTKALKVGWLELNCYNYTTLDWLLNWTPIVMGKKIFIIRSDEAPWQSLRIIIPIQENKLHISCIKKIIASQNSNLYVSEWKYIETFGNKQFRQIHFLVSGDELRRLEQTNWEVYFILEKLKVLPIIDGYSEHMVY